MDGLIAYTSYNSWREAPALHNGAADHAAVSIFRRPAGADRIVHYNV